MKKFFVLIITIILLSGCSASESNNKEIIGVSIVPQETFAKAIIGENYEVVTLIPPGSSPETHQPSIRTLEKLNRAKLYFSIGVETEKANILPTITEYENLEIIDLANAVDQIYPPRYFSEDNDENEQNHDHNGRDPHIWLSPKRVIVIVEIMTEKLINAYPKDKDLFLKNSKNYIKKLNDLDKHIQMKIKNADTKDFIIYHPSYGYFAEDYDLNMIEIETDGKKASINRIDEIAKIAKEKNIKTIYYQEEMSFKQAEIIANEIDGEIIKLKPLSSNYIESQKEFINTLVGD